MSYAVKEIFYTLQGEGANTGRPAVFCRFAGCNLWSGLERDRATATCQFCDTDFVGTDGVGGGKFATASVTSSVVGHVTDWDKFNAYVKKTGFFHLYQKRLSDASVRELFEQGKKVPGCEPFTKKRLNVRVIG